MTRALYYGWLGNRNLGDETLFHVNQLLFDGISLYTRGSLLSRLFPLKACILGGGTYINEKGSAASFIEIQQKMPLLVFGAGVQNPAFWSSLPGYVDARGDWNRILEQCPFVTVRGPHSIRTLEEQGFRGASIAGDPVLSLAQPRPMAKGDVRIGVNFGSTQDLLWGQSDRKTLEFFNDLLRHLKTEGYRVSLFSVCPTDTETMRKTEEARGLDMHVHYRYSGAVLNYFNKIDIFVGMKLHSVVLAHCAYTPSLMIEYRPKCADYMASMGLEAYNVRCDRAVAYDAASLVERMRQESGHHQEHLFQRITHYREIQENTVREMTRYLKGL